MCSTSLPFGKIMNESCQRMIDQAWLNVLTREYLDITPIHWLTFPPPSCFTHRLIGFLCVFLFIPGLCGNLLIIISFARVRLIRDPHTIFLLNLSIADLIMNLEIPGFIFNCFTCGPSFGVIGCKLHGFIGALSGTAALATITVISIERFIVIRYPFETKSRLSKKKSILVCLLVWLYSLLVTVPPLFGLVNDYIPEGFLTTCSFDYLSKNVASRVYVLTMFFTSYMIPLTLIVSSYTGVIFSMKKSSKQFTGSGRSECERTRSEARNFQCAKRSECELMKSCLMLITLWTVAWTPYAVVSLIGLFTDGSLITPEVSMFPAMFAKCASLADSYVYGLSHPGFRKEVKSKLIYLGILRKCSNRRTVEITSAQFRTLSKSSNNGTFATPSVAL